MARLYESADVPEFSTYPGSAEAELDRPELPPANTSPELNAAARRIGGALGKAVATVRSTADRASESVREASEQVQEKVQEIRSRTSEGAPGSIDELREQAQVKARELRSEARVRLSQARSRARVYVNEHPFGVILGAGVLGLLMGAVLRVSMGRNA